MRPIVTVFVLCASLSVCLACSCVQKTNLIDRICSSAFVGQVTPTKLVETGLGLQYYELSLPRSSKSKVHRSRKQLPVVRAYRSLTPMGLDCSGPTLELNKPYLLTGDFFDPDKKFVDYSTCKDVIPWADFKTMPEHRMFMHGCNKKH